jgi:hypothetical protein
MSQKTKQKDSNVFFFFDDIRVDFFLMFCFEMAMGGVVGGVAQVVELLTSECVSLSSSPTSTKKTKNKQTKTLEMAVGFEDRASICQSGSPPCPQLKCFVK